MDRVLAIVVAVSAGFVTFRGAPPDGTGVNTDTDVVPDEIEIRLDDGAGLGGGTVGRKAPG